MGREAYVDVAAPVNLDGLAARVAAILDVAVADDVGEGSDRSIRVGPRVFVEHNDRHARLPFTVAVHTGEGRADVDARRLFDQLKVDTDWALGLLNDGFATVDERPMRRAS